MRLGGTTRRYTVVVLGAYGNFGSIITHRLAADPAIEVIAGGRNPSQLQQLGERCGCRTAAIDIDSALLGDQLRGLNPRLVIHAAGPYQGQDYRVARACLDAGAHYLDLADARAFVRDITCLDQEAQSRSVMIAAGASSVPTLAAAVVDAMRPAFASLDSIHHGISSSSRMPGPATISAVLGYCGKAFSQWQDGRWTRIYGWQSLHAHDFPAPLGRRWMANCDVADLDVLPARYSSARSVRFSAGTGLKATQFGIWLLSWIVRIGAFRKAERLAPLLRDIAIRLERFGNGLSGMFVSVHGLDRAGKPLACTWEIIARRDRGPEIPCMAAVALARKLAAGWQPPAGALPCVGLLTLDEYLHELKGPDFSVHQRQWSI